MTISPQRLADFWQLVHKRGPQDCWPWKGNLYDGYGSFSIGGRGHKAHRASQIIHGIPPAPGEHVDHICRNRACVNPAHLRNIPAVANTMATDSEAVTAKNARKTHCTQGHELTPANLYLTGPNKTWRMCRQCALDRAAERERRMKESKA